MDELIIEEELYVQKHGKTWSRGMGTGRASDK